jgi:hypothetical protein
VHLRKTTCITGAVVCSLALGASSCTSQPFTANGKPRLAFVGDSITVQSTDDINAHYEADYGVKITALVGVGVKDAAPWVAHDAAQTPAIEVINLGTNDAASIAGLNRDNETVDEVNAELDAFDSEFPDSCVVFVTVNTHNPSWGPAQAAEIDAHIRATFPHVADWDAAYDPSYFDRTDTPHPNETGRQALLALEDAAIAGCTPAS